MAPGRFIESMQCHGRIKKGERGVRTKRSKLCQAHLNCYQNLRMTNSNIPNACLRLFCVDRQIKMNHPIVEYAGQTTKLIQLRTEIYTNYGRDYGKYYSSECDITSEESRRTLIQRRGECNAAQLS